MATVTSSSQVVHGPNVVWMEVKTSDHVEDNLAVTSESADSGDFFAALVDSEGTGLESVNQRSSR